MSGLYLAGLAAELGQERLFVADAVARGHYAAENAAADGYVSLCREPNRAPYDMALNAARAALAEAGVSGARVGTLAHASIHRHGQPRLWSPASWLQRQLGVPSTAPVLAVQQGCNGLMQLMASLAPLCAANPGHALLLTGADRFEDSGFDRWASDYGVLYGDAAAALVLSAQTGFARILHLAIDGVPELEALHRDAAATPEGPASWRTEYDIRRSKKAFLVAHGTEGFTAPLNAALARLRSGLLASAQWTGMVDWVFTPFVGAKIPQASYEAAFAPLGRTNGWQMGQHLGHLGTTDGWVGLAELRRVGALPPGSRVLIVAAGVGFSCSLCLVELL
ncbi:MAG: hypothetical protein ACT4NV_09790 [Rhodoferax sp.]